MYNVGDRVQLKNNLRIGTQYSGITFLDQMRFFEGYTFKISEAQKGKAGTYYNIIHPITGCRYWFGHDMLFIDKEPMKIEKEEDYYKWLASRV